MSRRVSMLSFGPLLAAGCVLTVLAAGPASAAVFPAAGTVTTMSEHTTGMAITCNNDRSFSLDLAGAGQLVAGASFNESGRIVTPLTTTIEDLVGHSPDFGTVTVHEARPGAGKLYETPGGGGRQVQILALNLVFTAEHDPCHPGHGPVTFTTGGEFVMVSRILNGYPPNGAQYSAEQIDLITMDGSTPVKYADMDGLTLVIDHVLT